MTDRRLRSAKGLSVASLLAVLGLGTGWLAFREAATRALPRAAPVRSSIAPDDPDTVLDRLMVKALIPRGALTARELEEVRRAAGRKPLDARPYLLVGLQNVRAGRPALAVRQLEEGQRLDPRQRIIHLLLLERYLRDGRYADAAAQFSVLARLVGAARGPIADALAKMSVAPETREATRRTLRSDPQLERLVLATLARSDTDPALILSLASPAAVATATVPDGWGPLLIERMTRAGRYAAARDLWRRLYRLPDAAVAPPLYDAGLRGLPGSAPFNWSLAASPAGAADLRDGAMSVEYYGRVTGELAGQLLVLRPGAYRFGVTATGSQPTGTGYLTWSVACAGREGPPLVTLQVPPVKAAPRRIAAAFTVPAGCPAQRLALTGNAGEFATPISATFRGLDLR